MVSDYPHVQAQKQRLTGERGQRRVHRPHDEPAGARAGTCEDWVLSIGAAGASPSGQSEAVRPPASFTPSSRAAAFRRSSKETSVVRWLTVSRT